MGIFSSILLALIVAAIAIVVFAVGALLVIDRTCTCDKCRFYNEATASCRRYMNHNTLGGLSSCPDFEKENEL